MKIQSLTHFTKPKILFTFWVSGGSKEYRRVVVGKYSRFLFPKIIEELSTRIVSVYHLPNMLHMLAKCHDFEHGPVSVIVSNVVIALYLMK